MTGWNTVALGEIADVFNGKTPSKSEQRRHGHPVLKIKDVSDLGEFRGGFDSFVDPKLADIYQSKCLREGDTLILNAAHNADYVASKTYRVTNTVAGALATGEWLVIRPAADHLAPGFSFHWVNSPHVRHRLRDLVKGIHLYPKDVRQLQVPLPSLPEQRRIADILDKADALRAKRRAALAKLDELAQSIFLSMFGDPIVNPRLWPLTELCSLGAVDRGVSKHRPRNAPELLGGQYPFVQTGDVANCDGYIRTHAATYSEVGLRQSKLWPAGTLCITIAANIAKTGILTFDACFPDSVVGFTSSEPATVEFVRILLSFHQQRLEQLAPESAQKNINLKVLRGLRVPIVPLELHREFARRLDVIERTKREMTGAYTGANALFASLQYRALRGDL